MTCFLSLALVLIGVIYSSPFSDFEKYTLPQPNAPITIDKWGLLKSISAWALHAVVVSEVVGGGVWH